MSHTSSHTVLEKIEKLRSGARMIYDTGVVNKQTPEQIGQSIEPLHAALNKLIKDSADVDVAGCVRAIQTIGHVLDSFANEIKFLQLKLGEEQHYQDLLKQALVDSMEKKGVTSLIDSGMSVTVVEKDGQKFLTFR